MQNPWPELPIVPPFLLPEDAGVIQRFNRKARPEHAFRTEILPEPFLGALDSPVVLLNLNPGFSDKDLATHAQPAFAQANRDQLSHASAKSPFYLLDPAFSFGDGYHWWSKRLRWLIDDAGRDAVASSLLCVEYFPYHSRKSAINPRLRVPSQEYGFYLVREALGRGALVVFLRARGLWTKAVPALLAYERVHELNSKQNAALSPRNCPAGYAAILTAIKARQVHPDTA